MEYVVQAFKVLKNLVHAEANARAQKTGFFVAFLTQTRFLCVITTELYLINLEIGLQYLVSQDESVRKNMAICDAFYVTIFLFLWRTPLA